MVESSGPLCIGQDVTIGTAGMGPGGGFADPSSWDGGLSANR